VRRLAREHGVDLRAVAGSGVLGRISAEDVVRFAEGGGLAPRPSAGAPAPAAAPLPDFGKWGETERVPMSGIRKATVRSMAQAWATVPMVTHFDEADATEFEALRQRYKDTVQRAGAKLTPTAMLVKVVASALRRFPDFNASIDVQSQEVVYKRYVNVGVAVDTDHGLLVPVIKHADRKNVVDLAVELEQLAAKARDRKLAPDDMSGGNFSVSNLGGIGGTGFTPIVAPPDVAILGVSRSVMKPVWNADAAAFEPRLVMPLALTYDHRLIDGASAARFLRWVCRAVEEPFLIALEG
jgi:pyruvate dehydrogenase E2 component (dihydrolipoamide acetyltransferase)